MTIVDDDPIPVASFSASGQSIAEGNSGTKSVTVTVTLSGTSSRTISVPFTISGSASNPADHNAAAGTLAIDPGQASGNITFAVAGDTSVESDETVVFTMGTPTNASKGSPAVHTVTIVNDDIGPDTKPDQFTFTDRSGVARNSLQTSNEITITGINTTVNVTVTGGSYSKNGAAFTTAAGIAVAGDRFRVQHVSSSYFEDRRDTTLAVGQTSDTFTSVTRMAPGDECNPICP